jgi:hypothetical protein
MAANRGDSSRFHRRRKEFARKRVAIRKLRAELLAAAAAKQAK